jgi:hypothetical protein
MEQIRKILVMSRQHYEKILLTVALLGLGIVVLVLLQASQAETNKIRDFLAQAGRHTNTPVRTADLSGVQALLRTATNPPALELNLPHRLFNPVPWHREAGSTSNVPLLKITSEKDTGWPKMVLTNVTPVREFLYFDRWMGSGKYRFYLTNVNEGARYRPISRFEVNLSVGVSNRFVLHRLVGKEDSPTEAIISWAKTTNEVAVPFEGFVSRIESYEGEIFYEPGGGLISAQRASTPSVPNTRLRVGDTFEFEDEIYKVLAITEHELVVSSQANDSKHTVRRAPSP